RLFEARLRAGVFAHALQNNAQVGEVARDGKLVVAFSINGQRTFGDREGFRVSLLMPTQKSEAAQRMTLERHVTTLPTDAQRRAQHAISRIEALEQRREIALPQIRLRESFRRTSRREQCDQLVDDKLLPATLSQCFALALLLQQH